MRSFGPLSAGGGGGGWKRGARILINDSDEHIDDCDVRSVLVELMRLWTSISIVKLHIVGWE